MVLFYMVHCFLTARILESVDDMCFEIYMISEDWEVIVPGVILCFIVF